MVTTRSSQEAAASTSSPTSSQGNKKSSPDIVGSKRKPPASRNEQNDTKKQKTLEESFNGNAPASEKESTDPTDMHKDDKVEATDDMTKDRLTSLKPNTSQTEEKSEDKRESTQSGSAVATAVEEDPKREEATPSNILEKGVLYFFFRGRVGIESPTNVNEIARSYIVLRPLPHGAKLSDGPIGDAGNSRLLALPKKVLPSSPKDRFMVFVEKVGTSFKDLRENFIASNDYETKTAGTRHSPAATPAGEGVYAITSTGRESHLAYILTIPSELGKVQKDLGLHERGSFITSVKNPKYESPVGASLPKGANYPQDLQDKFRSLRWIPLEARFLDHPNTQVLLIGEGRGEIDKAAGHEQDNEQGGEETPIEEMERLEDEDEERIKGLKGDETEAVFADLGLSVKEYPKVQTTWQN